MLPNPRPSLSSVLRRRFDSLKWDVKKCEDIVFDLQVGVSHFTSFDHHYHSTTSKHNRIIFVVTM